MLKCDKALVVFLGVALLLTHNGWLPSLKTTKVKRKMARPVRRVVEVNRINRMEGDGEKLPQIMLLM